MSHRTFTCLLRALSIVLVLVLISVVWSTTPALADSPGTDAASQEHVRTPDLSVDAKGPIAQISVSAWTQAPSNVAFAVSSPTGKTIWYQAIDSKNGSWSCSADLGGDFNAFGTYQVSVWATIAGETSNYGSVETSIAKPTAGALRATWSGPIVSLIASDWPGTPSNVAFEVTTPSGRTTWHQGRPQADGSWTADASVMSGEGDWGKYRVSVWATIGKRTYAARSIDTAAQKPTVRFASNEDDAGFDLTTTDWSVAPDNVAFKVTYPNGMIRWIQGSLGDNGNWSHDLAASAYGTYEAEVWATFDQVTLMVDALSMIHVDPIARGVHLNIETEGLGFVATVSDFPTSPKNVAFEITSPTGKTQWVQAILMQSDTWTAQVDASRLFGTWGAFHVKAWVTIGSKTIPVASDVSVIDKPTARFVASSPQLAQATLSTDSWSATPDNVAFQVMAPNNKSRWYQAERHADGSWSLSGIALNDDFGAWGIYRAIAWASFGSTTEAYGTQTIDVPKPSISVSVSDDSGEQHFVASGWPIAPENVAFEVTASSGASRWYQGHQQSDGSWTSIGSTFNDLLEWGSYRVTAWATYATSTESYGSTSTVPIKGVSVRYSASTVTNRWTEAADGAQVSGWDGTAAQRLNKLCIAVASSPVEGTIQYQALTPTTGWSPWQTNGWTAGWDSREGICAIRISATGALASYCDIWYRVYSVEYGGWLGWTKNGAIAGSQKTPLDIEAIQIIARPKGASAPGSTANSELTSFPGTYPLTSAQQRVLTACNTTPSPGGGLCAAWVTYVFENAGIGSWDGDARDMYNWYCFSSNLNDLRPGMIVAVPSHPNTYLGSIYGHVAIYIGKGKVMENVGRVQTSDLSSWMAHYGKTRTVKWGWLGNRPLL